MPNLKTPIFSKHTFPWLVCITLACTILPFGTMPAQSQSRDNSIYADALNSNWDNWSWNTTLNFSNPNPVHSGSFSMSAIYNTGWAGVFLHSTEALVGNEFESLSFWIHGGGLEDRFCVSASNPVRNQRHTSISQHRQMPGSIM